MKISHENLRRTQELAADRHGILLKRLPSNVSNRHLTTTWVRNKPGVFQVRLGPCNSVAKDCLLTTWQNFVPL